MPRPKVNGKLFRLKLPYELLERLEYLAKTTGKTPHQIVREHLETL